MQPKRGWHVQLDRKQVADVINDRRQRTNSAKKTALVRLVSLVDLGTDRRKIPEASPQRLSIFTLTFETFIDPIDQNIDF